MQSLTKLELIATRAALRRADNELALARGTFLTAAYVPGASVINSMLVNLHYLLAQIDRELARRP